MVPKEWVFVRGPKSVRLVRRMTPDRVAHLTLRGPEHQTLIYVGTPAACDRYQSDLELRLSAEGFRLDVGTSEQRARDTRLTTGRNVAVATREYRVYERR